MAGSRFVQLFRPPAGGNKRVDRLLPSCAMKKEGCVRACPSTTMEAVSPLRGGRNAARAGIGGDHRIPDAPKKEPRDSRGAFPSMASLAVETFPNDTLGRRRSAVSRISQTCWLLLCLLSPTVSRSLPERAQIAKAARATPSHRSSRTPGDRVKEFAHERARPSPAAAGLGGAGTFSRAAAAGSAALPPTGCRWWRRRATRTATRAQAARADPRPR